MGVVERAISQSIILGLLVKFDYLDLQEVSKKFSDFYSNLQVDVHNWPDYIGTSSWYITQLVCSKGFGCVAALQLPGEEDFKYFVIEKLK